MGEKIGQQLPLEASLLLLSGHLNQNGTAVKKVGGNFRSPACYPSLLTLHPATWLYIYNIEYLHTIHATTTTKFTLSLFRYYVTDLFVVFVLIF